MHNIDCILVGYNDLDFREQVGFLKKFEDSSGAYTNLKVNSVLMDGRRFTYMELLNKALKLAGRSEQDLHANELPNLGISYLSSFLKRNDLDIRFVNFYNREKEDFIALLKEQPTAVAITTTFYVDQRPIIEIIDFIRKHSPDTIVIVGGPHIFNICYSNDRETQDDIFRTIDADIYIYESQGESTLLEVLRALKEDDDPYLEEIPNLIWTEDGEEFFRSDKVQENNDLDANYVRWDSFDRDFYTPTVQVRTSHGCSFKCSFCRFPEVAGPIKFTQIDTVEKELDLLQAAGVKNVVFIDDTFNVPVPRFKDICRMMIRKNYDFNWFSFFRCANADDESFDLMAESGCKGVFLGIESGDQTILNNMNKIANVDRYIQGVKKLNERNIITFASMIVGFPGETEESVRNTIRFLNEAAPTFYRAEVYYHDDKVAINNRAEEFGLIGGGYSWKHNTMDWKSAGDTVLRMYNEVTHSKVLPLYMFDFWAIPYLLGKGITFDEIYRFVSVAQEMLLRSYPDRPFDTGAYDQRFKDIFS